jgi:hypothetical protein
MEDDYEPQRDEFDLDAELERMGERWSAGPRGEQYDIVNGAKRGLRGRFEQLPTKDFYANGTHPGDLDRYNQIAEEIVRLTRWVKSDTAFVALRAIKRLRRCVDELEHETVAIARGFGWSWRSIGYALGISDTAAHRRFARASVGPRKRRPRTTGA